MSKLIYSNINTFKYTQHYLLSVQGNYFNYLHRFSRSIFTFFCHLLLHSLDGMIEILNFCKKIYVLYPKNVSSQLF